MRAFHSPYFCNENETESARLCVVRQVIGVAYLTIHCPVVLGMAEMTRLVRPGTRLPQVHVPLELLDFTSTGLGLLFVASTLVA